MSSAGVVTDADEARATYLALARFPRTQCGADWQVSSTLQKEFAALTAQVDACAKAVAKDSEGQLWAPTAWHAALWLHSLSGQLFHTASDGPVVRLVFRGQGDVDWKLESARSRADNPGLEDAALRNLSYALNAQYRTAFKLSDLTAAFEGAGQHYGIRTRLVDFTTDPFVAVYFAATSKATRRGQCGVVFFRNVAELLQQGIQLKIPPPLVRRLHLQRGIFLEHTSSHTFDRTSFLEVRFPLEPEFRVYRNPRESTERQVLSYLTGENDKGGPVEIDIWQRAPWLTAATRLARRLAARGIRAGAYADDHFLENLFAPAPPPQVDGREVTAWIWSMNELLYELARSYSPEGEVASLEIVQALWRDNPGLFHLMLQLFKQYLPSGHNTRLLEATRIGDDPLSLRDFVPPSILEELPRRSTIRLGPDEKGVMIDE